MDCKQERIIAMRPYKLIMITTMTLLSSVAFADDDDKDTNWQRSTIYSAIATNTTSIQNNESAIDDLDSRIQTNTNNIQSLHTQLQNLPTGGGTGTADPQTQVNTTAISDLNTRVQTNTNTLGGLTTQVQSNTTAISNNTVQIQANTDSIGGMQTSQQNLQFTVDNLITDLGATQTDLINLSTQVQTNSSRLDVLENDTTGGGGPTSSPTTIDFTPYVTTFATKDFQIINGGACTTALQQIARTDTATGADITITETLTSGTRDCSTFVFGYTLTAETFATVSFTNLTLGQSYTFDQPGELLTSSMEPGKAFGFAVLATNNQALATIQKNTLLGIESVTVPFGTFDNCLKMHSQITSSMMNDVEQISWICGNGVGEVRRIYMDRAIGQTRTYVLRNAS
jgi:hypothetical protein